MIKKLILSTLRKLIVFLNVRLKIKKHPPSPPDYYFSEVSKNSYDYFKKYFDKAYVFSDDNSIRRFSISKAAKNLIIVIYFLNLSFQRRFNKSLCKYFKRKKYKNLWF